MTESRQGRSKAIVGPIGLANDIIGVVVALTAVGRKGDQVLDLAWNFLVYLGAAGFVATCVALVAVGVVEEKLGASKPAGFAVGALGAGVGALSGIWVVRSGDYSLFGIQLPALTFEIPSALLGVFFLIFSLWWLYGALTGEASVEGSPTTPQDS